MDVVLNLTPETFYAACGALAFLIIGICGVVYALEETKWDRRRKRNDKRRKARIACYADRRRARWA